MRISGDSMFPAEELAQAQPLRWECVSGTFQEKQTLERLE